MRTLLRDFFDGNLIADQYEPHPLLPNPPTHPPWCMDCLNEAKSIQAFFFFPLRVCVSVVNHCGRD